MSKWSKRNLVLIAIAILISQFAFPVWAKTGVESYLEVHFIDVGQGDSILLHSSEGADILIDAGNPDQGNKVLVYIRRQGIKELDLVIGSHPHADHIGGLATVLEGIPVGEVIDPGVAYPSGIFENYLSVIKEKQIPFTTVLSGDDISVEDDPGLQLEVFAPYEEQLDYADDVNDVSIVLKVTYGDVSFLFTGDAGFDTENILIEEERFNLESTVLKIGHHGSRHSTGSLFLRKVTPELAVIPVGENNYGHPTDDVLENLEEKDVKIYRNDLHGSVVISTDGANYQIETEKTPVPVDDHRVNINKAPLGDIIEIPGIDYDLARAMVKYREYNGIFLNEKELLCLDLMTPELLEEILPYIKFAN